MSREIRAPINGITGMTHRAPPEDPNRAKGGTIRFSPDPPLRSEADRNISNHMHHAREADSPSFFLHTV
jgi:hypothetical protein